MKKIILPVVAIAVLYLLGGCSTKFNVAAPYKNITVIYAFLDMADTAHYVRIQKAFLDDNKSALTMAQSPDSNFYSNINVRIERFSFADTIHWHDTIHLNRVDLAAEGYPKQPGVFFNAPNYAYKFTNVLETQYIYRIVVTNLTTGQVDSANAPIIEDLNHNLFNMDVFDDTLKVRGGLDFASSLPNKFFDMFGTYAPPGNFSFEGYNTPVGIAQAIIRFNWYDSNTVNHTLVPHYSDFNVGFLEMNGGQLEYQVYNTSLYSAIASGMGAAPNSNTIRLLDRSDVFIYLSTYDFVNYERASLTAGTGLTGSEIEPTYTNVKGSNALGLFTSRAMRTGKLTLTDATVDSLMISPLMKNANLRGTIYH